MKKYSANYILRIDDVCPTMNWDLFSMITDACDEYAIKPILGIVPDNRDSKLIIDEPNATFWEYIKQKASCGWIIAQHGYRHIYDSSRKTEFAGLLYSEQYRKIQRGQEILHEKLGFKPTWWMAPAHSFDKVTCKALKALNFTHITDGIALYPYKKHGLTWIPQQLWQPREMPFGTWTICLHPNTMQPEDIHTLVEFLKYHSEQFQNISLSSKKSLLNMPFKAAWNVIKMLKKYEHS